MLLQAANDVMLRINDVALRANGLTQLIFCDIMWLECGAKISQGFTVVFQLFKRLRLLMGVQKDCSSDTE